MAYSLLLNTLKLKKKYRIMYTYFQCIDIFNSINFKHDTIFICKSYKKMLLSYTLILSSVPNIS